ncbi:MAG: DUF1599 domain-containing protein [Cytophagia bacterium]|nr:MAG: DUF1599 domain-containing protein [Cytophagales bacterium]TAG03066.1 MAG: DUF1599 domain-containing protein [Cytophagia bacterium]TAG42264.1 MAG: DUF1599 domain-containing protein [Cytophagia bacterium]TAH28602.1 MAG: DUF1599 domain-containing protein [Cytophagales bacterium]
MQENTATQYQKIIQNCQNLFRKKNQDYGTSWRVLRLSSLTDQIYIKAKRIRSIQEKGSQKIADNIEGEFIGMINYSIMALIQIDLENQNEDELNLSAQYIDELYTMRANKNWELLANKNHDYGEAWREMRISSMTDLILMKLLRIKQIEDNEGQTLVSEGVESGYQDIINYAVFCLIKMEK